jgi:hypothetical protein
VGGLKAIGTAKKPGAKSPAGVTPKAPPPAKTAGRPLPDLGMPTKAPRGPALLHLGQKRQQGFGGPGEQPVDFPGSGAEWVWFWASRKYFWSADHREPRQAPFDGGSTWVFQSPDNPANPREAGASISDFVYTLGGRNYIVRIEGFYWHIGKGPTQQARDQFLINQAGSGSDEVVRVNDTEFMEDISGATAIKLLAEVLSGNAPVGQLQGGTAQAPRYADFGAGTAS